VAIPAALTADIVILYTLYPICLNELYEYLSLLTISWIIFVGTPLHSLGQVIYEITNESIISLEDRFQVTGNSVFVISEQEVIFGGGGRDTANYIPL